MNSLAEKKEEVQSRGDFIKIFSNKIASKDFINKKISKKNKKEIEDNLLEISDEALEKKNHALEKHLVYS